MFGTIKNLVTRKRFKTLADIERKCVTYNALGLVDDEEFAELIVYAREIYTQ